MAEKEEDPNDKWLEIGTIPIKLAVDADGKPRLALFLRNGIGDGTLGNGRRFDVATGMAGNTIVNVYSGGDEHGHVFMARLHDLMTVVDEYMTAHYPKEGS
ncbi:MAG: hypothetical protein GY769_20150 [bacterium]|nr:hypothetical protein [bacterium]